MWAVCVGWGGIVDSTLVFVVVGLVMIGLGVYMIKLKGHQVDTFEDKLDTFHDAWALVSTYAPAADQLVKIGELEDKDRLNYVIAMVMDMVDGIDVDQVRGIVEAWVIQHKEKKE